MFVPIFDLSVCYLFMHLIQSIHSATPCVYRLKNGEELDVRTLGNSNKTTPKYDQIPNASPIRRTFSWNGCFDYSKSDGGDCTNAAACYTDSKTGVSTLLTAQSDAKFEEQNQTNVLSYRHGSMLVTISLQCRDANEETILGRQDSVSIVNIDLQSRCCCPGKCYYAGNSSSISGGTIFLIILFALLFVYIVGGMIFLKIARGATGADMILNRFLWLNILSYVIYGLRYCIQVIRHCSFAVEYQKT